MPRSKNELAAVVIIALIHSAAWALESDRSKPIHIEADRVTIDDQKKISRYSGAVKMSQGSIQATADEITVYSGADGPEQIVLTGNPATFRQRPEGKTQDAYGRAQRIEHNTDREVTLFIGAARFWQGQEEFAGERIEYQAVRDLVRAQGSSDGSSRVRIVIQPRNQPDKQDADNPAEKAAQ